MFRRIFVLAVVGLVVTASPALADYHWHSQMKHGSATTSRKAGGCSIRAGSHKGSLRIACASHHSASLTYVFPRSHGLHGHPSAGIDGWGTAKLKSALKVSCRSIQVTLTVSGPGTRQVDSVSVEYYAH